jgi:hypothetical protein
MSQPMWLLPSHLFQELSMRRSGGPHRPRGSTDGEALSNFFGKPLFVTMLKSAFLVAVATIAAYSI